MLTPVKKKKKFANFFSCFKINFFPAFFVFFLKFFFMQSPFVDDWGRLSPPLNTVGRKNQNLDGATTRNLALELYSTTASTSLIFSCGFAVSFYLVACMFLSPSPANSTFDYPTAPFSSQSLFDILWTHLNFCLFPLLLAVFVVAVRVFMGFTAIKKFLVIVKDLNLAGSSSGGLTNIERKQVYLPILQKSVKRLVAASVLGIAFMVSLCFASPRFRELNASMLAATVAAAIAAIAAAAAVHGNNGSHGRRRAAVYLGPYGTAMPRHERTRRRGQRLRGR